MLPIVVIVGRPNVGKSTLVNACMGEKIAITSPVAQTTRRRLRAVVNTDEGQIIIVDTPGLHKPKDALGKELNVPILILSQLSRAPDARADHRPQLSDLRESGALEQDADIVMFIYREDRYKGPEDEDTGEAEIIIAKQRNGPVGTVKLAFISDYTRFENLERGGSDY